MIEFYRALAQVSSTLLGLWLVVVGQRWEDWHADPQQRLATRLVTVHFALPSLMSLVSLTDPDGTLLWRVGFALLAAVGVVAVVAFGPVRDDRRPWWERVARPAALVVYVAVAGVALLADVLATRAGVDARQVEAVLLSLLMLVNVHLVLSLLFRGDVTVD